MKKLLENINFFLAGLSGQKKVNKNESQEILMGIRSLMSLGYSIFNSLKIFGETVDNKKIKKIIDIILYRVEYKNVPIEDELFRYKIINDEEYVLFTHSSNAKETIEDILKLRKLKGNFLKTIGSLFTFPIIALYIGLAIAYYLLPIVNKPIDKLKIIAEQKGIDVNQAMDIPSIFFYINHYEWIKYITISLTLFLILLVVLYFYFDKYKPQVLYKYLSLKSYDDMPFILMIMRSLNKSGVDIYNIAKTLSEANLKPGFRALFKRIKIALENTQPIYMVFKKYHFPKDIYTVLKISEISRNFWGNFDNLIQYSINVNHDKNEMVKNLFSGISKVIGYIFIIYFLIGILLLMFSMQNLATVIQ